jgi:hypothetical protein
MTAFSKVKMKRRIIHPRRWCVFEQGWSIYVVLTSYVFPSEGLFLKTTRHQRSGPRASKSSHGKSQTASAIVNTSDLDKNGASQRDSYILSLGTFCVRCCILKSSSTIDAPRIVLRTVGNMNDARTAVPGNSLNIQRMNPQITTRMKYNGL